MRSASWDGAAGLGGEDHQALAGAVGADPGVAVEREVADEVVAVVLGAVAGAVDVVLGPPGAEVGVLDGQFADEAGEFRVVGVGRGLHAQRGDGFTGVVRPVLVHGAERRVA